MRETSAAFGATWCQEETGEVVASTWGGTMCWSPRSPWRMKFAGDGFEGIIRCGECPGCLEFDRRRLADRLHRKYLTGAAQIAATTIAASSAAASGADKGALPLFAVRIWAKLLDQAALSHRLHRRRHLELEPGFFRLGDKSFALLSREITEIKLVLLQLRLKHRIERVRFSRRRRAWRVITAGVLIAREVYGEQVKRWYVPGLPAAEKKSWEVEKHAMQKPWQRATGARARRAGNLVLVPPAVWRLRTAERSALRREYAAARSPEGVATIMGLVTHALERTSQSLLTSAAGRPLLDANAVREFYVNMAKRKRVASESEPHPNPISPPSKGGGYISSIHTQSSDRPGESAGDIAARQKRELEARKKRLLDEQIARFLELGRKVGRKE